MRVKNTWWHFFLDHGILRAENGLRFADELRSPEDLGLPRKEEGPTGAVRKFEN